jgi:hypothetical protein
MASVFKFDVQHRMGPSFGELVASYMAYAGSFVIGGTIALGLSFGSSCLIFYVLPWSYINSQAFQVAYNLSPHPFLSLHLSFSWALVHPCASSA